MNQRIIMIKLKTKNVPLFAFQLYAPESSYSDDEKKNLYVALQQELNNLPRKIKLIPMGYFNRKLGKEGWINWKNNVRKFSKGIMNCSI